MVHCNPDRARRSLLRSWSRRIVRMDTSHPHSAPRKAIPPGVGRFGGGVAGNGRGNQSGSREPRDHAPRGSVGGRPHPVQRRAVLPRFAPIRMMRLTPPPTPAAIRGFMFPGRRAALPWTMWLAPRDLKRQIFITALTRPLALPPRSPGTYSGYASTVLQRDASEIQWWSDPWMPGNGYVERRAP